MFTPKQDEREYAFLPDQGVQERNKYGQLIDLADEYNQPRGVSLKINGDDMVGDNPNRNKQHGFHFTADNCIACHACEAACSEKNDLPPHLSFRSVGYVEGGTYPSFQRMNISMACNHCDDPVCLKGCPTRAYTKHAEYGAVLQDPETCFGCGYCTWRCPYNAPQLDPVKGRVEKCNMCVDRLEVGLKPACVAACLGNALNFGVIENTPENRDQAKVNIPGFPDPEISHPNIRFQQTRSLPRELIRTDSQPVKYYRDDNSDQYKPVVDKKNGVARFWNLKKLSSRENPLVLFTLATQAAIGALFLMLMGPVLGVESLEWLSAPGIKHPLLFVMAGLQAVVLFLSTLHLGKPMRFYRGFNNLRHSPVSREALGVSIFFGGLGAYWFFSLSGSYLEIDVISRFGGVMGVIGLVAGLVGLYFMHMIYRIPARPYWNHWQVLTAFYGTMLYLGSLLAGLITVPVMLMNGNSPTALIATLAGIASLGLISEGIGRVFHIKDLKKNGGEGAASLYTLETQFGKTNMARLGVFAVNTVLALALTFGGLEGLVQLGLASLLGLSMIATSLVDRALFYVLVIPTTMPGAFFWKNKAFEEHARESGLANMPQVGVVPDVH